MCRKFILASSLETIEKRFSVIASTHLEWNPGIVVSPGDTTLVITQQCPKALTLSTFGMIAFPGRALTRAIQPISLINARAEGSKNPENDPFFTGSKAIFMKPAFKRPLVSQRCIVIADAFIEWSSDIKRPFLVYLRNRERPFGMAGLYTISIHPGSGTEMHSFTIITVPGNPLIHTLPASRMPVIIPKGRETDWLRPSNHLGTILGMLEIFPAGKMNAYPLRPDTEFSAPCSSDILKPAGVRLFPEVEKKLLPHPHFGHKQKSAGQGTWSGKN